jgi:hypothetical protein
MLRCSSNCHVGARVGYLAFMMNLASYQNVSCEDMGMYR